MVGMADKKNTKRVCPSCSSQSVFLSEYRGIESIFPTFLPCNVYRCLDCNNRYWAFQPLFANPARVWGVTLIGFAVLISVFLYIQPDITQANLSRKAEFIPQFDSLDKEELITANIVETAELELEPVEPVTAALTDSSIDVDEPTEALIELSNSESSVSEVIDAKVQSEKISSASKASLERLESAVVEDKEALASLLKVDINYAIENWRKAWQSGDTENYLNSYGANFEPANDLTFEQWQAQRRTRVLPSKKIELELSDFDVSFENQNQQAVAIFTQAYSSSTYSDTSRKKLLLENQQSSWKIISEQQIQE